MILPSRLFSLLRPSLAASLTITLALLGAGCSDVPKGQSLVKFESTPTGASVSIDGTVMPGSTTPTSAMLSKENTTKITFSKLGFTPLDIMVNPHGSESTLRPNPAKASLKPDMLPAAPGPDPQAEMARSIEIVRQYVAMGRLAKEDQVYAEEQIKIFYTQTPPATPPPPDSPPAPSAAK